jgi:hypothetical protein
MQENSNIQLKEAHQHSYPYNQAGALEDRVSNQNKT